jgi:PAS domain-containing protein
MQVFSSSDGLCVGLCRFHLDHSGKPKLIHANDRLLELIGLQRAEFMASPSCALRRVRPEDLGMLCDAGRAAARDRRPFRWQGQLLRDGESRSILLEASPSQSADCGDLWDGVVLEIEAPKAVEPDLAAVLEAAQAFTWRRDLRGRRSEFDTRWAVLAGHPPGELTAIIHEVPILAIGWLHCGLDGANAQADYASGL